MFRRSDEVKRLEEVSASIADASVRVALGHVPASYLSDIADGSGEEARRLYQSITSSQGPKAAHKATQFAIRNLPEVGVRAVNGSWAQVRQAQDLTRGALEAMTGADLS